MLLYTPPPTRQEIRNLCRLLENVREATACLGFLKDCQRNRRFDIHFVRKRPQLQASKDIVRLENLLSESANSVYRSSSISAFHRKYLALILASTVVQLRETPWLAEQWGKQDIYFIRRVDGAREPIYEEPYISKPFMSDAIPTPLPPSRPPGLRGPMVRNATLFALGKFLIELSFGRPLEALRESSDMGKNNQPNRFTDWCTAERLIKNKEIAHREGAMYADAVRRCIRCEFDQVSDSLGDPDFRRAVFEKVILPLEKDLKHFNGGKLPQLP